ncbi:MAG TPA: VOC family protein [Gammaproteobacteria bacterium]
MSPPKLAYVGIAVNDAPGVAEVMTNFLGLARRDAALGDGTRVPLLSVGETALALFETGHPFLGGYEKPGVHHIAVAAAAPRDFARSFALPPDVACPDTGIDGVDQCGVEPAATCGVRTRICPPLSLARGNGGDIQRIDHLGVASADNAAAIAVFNGQLGCPVESSQTDMEVRMAVESFTSDKYGVVYHSRPPEPVGGLRVTFLTIGDCELEFLQPFDAAPENADDAGPAHNRPGNTRGDRGAIGRYIERRGPGLHHVALKTPHINRLLPELAGRGLRMIDTKGRPGSRRALIGFIHPAALGGLLLHFVERDE